MSKRLPSVRARARVHALRSLRVFARSPRSTADVAAAAVYDDGDDDNDDVRNRRAAQLKVEGWRQETSVYGDRHRRGFCGSLRRARAPAIAC